MAQIRKFLFETDFDQPSRPAKAQAAPEKAQKPKEPPPPSYGEEDLAAARREGFEAGRAEALREAEESAARRLADAGEQLAAGLAGLRQRQEAANAALAADAMNVALAAVRKMLPELARRHGLEEVTAVLRECVARLTPEARVLVRVHPELAAPLRETVEPLRLRSGFSGALEVTEDETVAPGDCRVDWDDGGAERDSEKLWRDIEAIIRRHMDATQAAAPAPAAQDGTTPAADAPAPVETEEA